MSSILTNNGAMVALQTLKSINKGLAQTQSMISTGKSIATAKDNAALWSISKVMESDVKGFKAISDSLSLGESTVAVAQNGAETITDLLTKMKGKIVAAQEQNVDRVKIQTDIATLRDQIGAVAGAAQFNGLNLLSNNSKTAGTGTIDVLSSLDRSSNGSVASSNISIRKQDLGTAASSITGTAVAVGTDRLSGAANDAAVTLTGAGTAPTTSATITSTAAGEGYSIAITTGAGVTNTANANSISYVARDGDTAADVATGLAASFNKYIENTLGTTKGTIAATVTNGTITFTGSSTVGVNFGIQAQGFAAAGNTIGGGLADLATIDVSTASGAESALSSIEGLISTAIGSAAAFGSARGRIETQSEFVNKLTDSLRTGIGSIVDANMEEASARLQALQVQQQLGVQSLSIANQAPQSILSLFR